MELKHTIGEEIINLLVERVLRDKEPPLDSTLIRYLRDITRSDIEKIQDGI